MTLHLLKLSVGADSIADIAAYQAKKRPKGSDHCVHVTRMVPRRADELLDGGSLYWVIKGRISVRQALKAIEPFVDVEGISRCRLVLDPVLVAVVPRPFRAFQGWRYLADKDRPADLEKGADEMPDELRLTLAALGLV
ncbi:MAG TPA: DUF1489 domain-containing protein [Methylovirgula sp.]|nr:DUF1489 domain-containing protein [Methylovirgula sp.]